MKHIMRNIWVVLVLLASSVELFAQTQEVPWVFEEGKTYEVTSEMQYKELYAQYTATADGMLVLSYSGCNPLPVYTDKECLVELVPQPEGMGWSPIVTEMAVKAGETYYFYDSFVMNTGRISVEIDSGDAALELVGITPDGGSIVASCALINLTFNRNVLCDSVIIRSGEKEKAVTYNINGTFLVLDLGADLMDWFKQGVIKEGSELQIELLNVRNSKETMKYGESGRLLLTYVMAAKPMELISTENSQESTENIMNVFPSYLLEGTCLILKFDAPVACSGAHVPVATLMYGDQTTENNYYYEENLAMDFTEASEGIIKVEYGGKLRRVLDMIPHFVGNEEDKFKTIAVQVRNICSLDGEYAYSPGSGNLGTYTYNYDYVELNNNIIADITPKSGSIFDNNRQMEIWIRGNGLLYDGVRFDYIVNGEPSAYVIKKEELTIEKDEDDSEAVIITLHIPEINPDPSTQVVVSLENMKSTDGLDYSSRLTATYNVNNGTGIQTGVAEQERVDVYLLTGEELLKDAPREALNQLKRGMYIVNGKKWMKKG